MRKISLTKMITLGLILGMTTGVVVNNIAAAETAESYATDIFIFTAIFLRMVRMIIAPLVILTLVIGIAKTDDARTLGRVFSKTFFLFICTFLVLTALDLVIVNILRPDVSTNFVPYDVGAVAAIRPESFTLKVSISHVVPTSIVDAMARNEVLQVAVLSVFPGCSPTTIGEKADPIVRVLDLPVHVMLKPTSYVMLSVPLTMLAIISGLVAERGLGAMVNAGIFIGEFHLTLGMLQAILIGLSTMIVGPCIARSAKSILEPALLAFITSNSETVFPGTLDKLEKFDVSSKIVSFVLPIGYSFNLVGSVTCCSFTTVFITQTCNIKLSMGEQIAMLLILMLTPKGMAGISRAPMVVITTTLDQFNIPEAGLILLMGVDPFLDMGRSATNVMSNAMKAAIVSRWEGEHFGQDYRGSALTKSPEQGRPVTETEVALSWQQKNS